jgi:heme exporter protein C|tara:strand:+ start:90 stop:797 length:708 start_codon:yes stop_codon:yes gene_type:complete
MYKNFLPNKFISLKNNFTNILVVLLFIIATTGLIYSLLISPPDHIQGDSVRIMYVHVPSSFIALGCFAFLGFISILNLIFKIKIMPLLGKSAAPIGCVFSLISIVTGSLWGKPTWGTWWVWDARLTSMAILFLFYIAYIYSWKFISSFENANRTSSFIAIIGLFNLPIIKFSVDWWNTLHQPSSITLTSAPTIHHTMLIPLVIMFFAMLIYSLLIFLMRYRTELIKIKLIKKNYE